MTPHTDLRPPRRLCAEQRAQARVALATTAGVLTGSLWRERRERQGKLCAPQCRFMGPVSLLQTTIPGDVRHRDYESVWHIEHQPARSGAGFSVQAGDVVLAPNGATLIVIGRITGAQRWHPFLVRFLVNELKPPHPHRQRHQSQKGTP